MLGNRTVAVGFIVFVTLTAANLAQACGDSLYRAGKGIAYRTYTAPLPGNLLIFGESESAMELAAALERSGHTVQVVRHHQGVAAAMASNDFDVVIAAYEHRLTFHGSIARSEFIPVVTSGADAAAAKKSFDAVMIADKHKIKHYLKAIHRVLKKNA